jgi:hypothetical protein
VESVGLWGILLVLSVYSIRSIEFQRFKSLRIDFDVIAEMLEHTEDSDRRLALIERANQIAVEASMLGRQMNGGHHGRVPPARGELARLLTRGRWYGTLRGR